MNQTAKEERLKVYADALETFGPEVQLAVALEEMSELQKELCKALRGFVHPFHVAEELADAAIMLEQMLLPIRKQHAANIYAGTKTVELRKTVPRFDPGSYNPAKYPFRVYMYESKADGGAGAITGFFSCPGYLGTCGQYMEDMAQRAQVSMDYLLEYAAGGWVYGWEVREPTRLPEPVALSTLGIDRAPQSWRYLGTDACTTLEVAARGSPAE